MNLQFILLVVSFFALSVAYAQETDSPKFGNGVFNLKGKDSTWSMKIGARIQLLGSSRWSDSGSGFTYDQSSFLVRRARFKFDGFAFSPKLVYKLELGLSNNDIAGASEYTSHAPRYILDAVMKWNFYENFVLWFGQAKLPGNRERLISSGDLQFVNRSFLNSAYTIDRDLGIQLHHRFKLSEKLMVREAFAISQGEGRNVTFGNIGGFQYTTRLEVLPFGDFVKKGDYVGGDIFRESTPKLAVGATYDFNNNAVKTRSNQGSYMITDTGFHETNISTLFIDAMFKYRGFSLMAEYADRTATDPIARNSDGSLTGDEVQVGNGMNFQAGYLFTSNWEVSGRYSNVSLDEDITGRDVKDQYTFGVSKYIVGHKLKVQSDVSYLAINNLNNELLWRLQFAIHF